MIHVLFVCLGNVCRSPMAEAMFKQMINERHLDGQFEIRSRGTSDEEEGNPPQPGTQAVLKQHHLSKKGLIAHQIQQKDFQWADYIITMDHQNLADLKAIAPADCRNKIHLCLDILEDHHNEPIPDPWYTHRFEDTYESLAMALPQWLERMLKEQKQ